MTITFKVRYVLHYFTTVLDTAHGRLFPSQSSYGVQPLGVRYQKNSLLVHPSTNNNNGIYYGRSTRFSIGADVMANVQGRNSLFSFSHLSSSQFALESLFGSNSHAADVFDRPLLSIKATSQERIKNTLLHLFVSLHDFIDYLSRLFW